MSVDNMTIESQNVFQHSINSTAINVLLIVIFLVLIAWTILGNLTVILAIKRSRVLRKSASNILVANLAISDLLVGIMVLPLSATVEVFGCWPMPEWLCYFWLVIGKMHISEESFR